MNVIAQSIIKRCNIKIEPYSYPFKVAQVDKTNLIVFHRCKVPIQIRGYKDEIFCDVLPMDVALLLLGRPWLYDRNVFLHGRGNTYTFRFQNKYATLTLCRLKELLPFPSPKSSLISSLAAGSLASFHIGAAPFTVGGCSLATYQGHHISSLVKVLQEIREVLQVLS